MAKKVTPEEIKELLFAPVPEGHSAPQFEQSVQSLYLDEYGREKPNPYPLEPPIGYKKQPTIAELMRQAIRQASEEARSAGYETEEEANDFDIDDEFDPSTPYEHDFEPDPLMERMIALQSRPPKKEPAAPAAGPAPTPAPAGPVPQQ